MKIKQKNISNKRMLELHLIKSRIYEQKTKNSSNPKTVSLLEITTRFKKALKIIFKYNQKNKKILFINLPLKLTKKINRSTNHASIPNGIKLQGIISNDFKLFNSKLQSHTKYLLPKLKAKPDLIVLFDSSLENSSILKESYLSKIPLIHFGGDVNKRVYSSSYIVPGNLNFLHYNSNIFFICLNFLFKKSHFKSI